MYVYKGIGGQVFVDKTLTTPVKPAAGAYKVLVADFEVHQADIVLV